MCFLTLDAVGAWKRRAEDEILGPGSGMYVNLVRGSLGLTQIITRIKGHTFSPLM